MRRLMPALISAVGLLAAAAVAATGSAVADAAATGGLPTVVAIRAAHHPGYDRVVFEFRGGLPAHRNIRYVSEVLGAGSGEPVNIAGRAKLQVDFRPSRANDGAGHPTVANQTAYALKNIIEVHGAGDLDGATRFGVGLAKKTSFDVFTLRSPDRVVIDISNDYRTVPVKVWLIDHAASAEQGRTVLRAVSRQVVPPAVATGALDRLFAGATPAEQQTGLRSRRFTVTSWTGLSISGGIARVRLTGMCDGRVDVGLADEMLRTLKQFPTVDAVKIYDLEGHTPRPHGVVDSVPSCLCG